MDARAGDEEVKGTKTAEETKAGPQRERRRGDEEEKGTAALQQIEVAARERRRTRG